MMPGAVVRTTSGWRQLGTDPAPGVRDTETISVRGLRPGSQVRIGYTVVAADGAGEVSVRPAADENLSGHVGFVPCYIDGAYAGEIELIAHKMSEAAYRTLRADLHRVWTDLVFADHSPTAVEARPPSARELWRRIDRPVMQILEQPSTLVEVGVEPRRLDRVRRLRELTPAVVRAGQHRRPALTRTLRRTTDTPENHLCAATLRLLRSHARSDPDATDIVSNIERLLRHPALPSSMKPVHRVTWGMHSDRRYRQVLAVHQLLNRPELEATEGPGELRLGVPALSRLYEYWTFLQVLIAASKRYGPPEREGFGRLAVPVRGNRHRLEIPRGTTVTFPGPVHIAFEPNINTRSDGWMGLEYVPHPDPARQQLAATPDIAVLHLGGRDPVLTLLDAKYVGRAFVEYEAARLHDKYARIRLDGTPVVDSVVALHPHIGLERQWAGYGHIALAPGHEGTVIPLPDAGPTTPAALSARGPEADAVQTALPSPADAPPDTAMLYVVADQYWMRLALAGRRIDLDAMRQVVAGDRSVERFVLAMPHLGQLVAFGRAAELSGWHVEWLESAERASQLSALEALIRSFLPAHVIVVSGDPNLLARLPTDRIETFRELAQVPGLGG